MKSLNELIDAEVAIFTSTEAHTAARVGWYKSNLYEVVGDVTYKGTPLNTIKMLSNGQIWLREKGEEYLFTEVEGINENAEIADLKLFEINSK